MVILGTELWSHGKSGLFFGQKYLNAFVTLAGFSDEK